MSSRSLVSPPPKRIKTEDGMDLNYVELDLVVTGEVDLNRAKNKKHNAKNEPPSKCLRDDGEQRSELAPLDSNIVVTDVVTLGHCLPEVWKDIFDTLDSGDLQTCFRTCSKWRNLLAHKRTLLLFPEVASLLFPPNDPTLLECRKVCKSWKDDVDSQVHRSLVLLPFEKGAADESFTVVFETIETIRQFLDYSGNPFPWGSIKIGWDTDTQQDLVELDEMDAYLRQLQSNLIQLLDAFGHYIYYVQFDLNFYQWQLGSPDLLREVLLRVPNLRKLEIRIENLEVVAFETVREYYAANPLPQLAHLETLILEDTMEYDAVPVLCSYIPPQSLSIKRMDVPRFYEAMHDFPNLEVYKGRWFNDEDLERFRNAAQKSAFKKLFLALTAIEEEDEARVSDFQQVFTSLSLFAESLEYLRVSRCGLGTLILRDNDFRINLPKLKFLRINDFDGCLDTLIELTSLRHLEVEFAQPGVWDGDSITVLGIRKQINVSNIWELLPKLEILIVRDLWNDGKPRKYKRDFSTGLIVEVEVEVQGFKVYSDAGDEDEGSENDSSEDTDDEGDEGGENDEEGDESSENDEEGDESSENDDDDILLLNM